MFILKGSWTGSLKTPSGRDWPKPRRKFSVWGCLSLRTNTNWRKTNPAKNSAKHCQNFYSSLKRTKKATTVLKRNCGTPSDELHLKTRLGIFGTGQRSVRKRMTRYFRKTETGSRKPLSIQKPSCARPDQSLRNDILPSLKAWVSLRLEKTTDLFVGGFASQRENQTDASTTLQPNNLR